MQQVNMSSKENSIVCIPACQGFLKKRKDRIRLRWVTYWFELHNATLYFYNQKHGVTSDLRGQYYLFEVVFVREVTWTKKKQYSFEIVMKNGKKKVLAAESADVRQLWMNHLSQAMKCCFYNLTEQNSYSDTAPDYQSRLKFSPCSTLCNPQSEVANGLISRRYSAESEYCMWPSSKLSTAAMSTATSLIYINYDMSLSGDVLQMVEENNYDVLPCFKPLQTEEAIYDTPPSNRRISEQEYETEHIYDVPNPVLRRKSVNDPSCTTELPEITGLLQEMVTCLGGNSEDWVRATAPSTICQTKPVCKV